MARPTKLTDEVREKALDYAAGGWRFEDGHNIPSVVGLAMVLGVSKSTLYLWEEKDAEFSDILRRIVSSQEFTLLNNGLSGDFNAAITKLVLGKHGYHDKQETDVTSSDGSMKPTVIELVGVTSESTAKNT